MLRPNDRAVLAVLQDADRPLTARTVSDASGVALSTTGNVLAVLCAQGLAARRRKGRAWLYRRKRQPARPHDLTVEGRLAAAAAAIGAMPAGQADRQFDRLEARAGAR